MEPDKLMAALFNNNKGAAVDAEHPRNLKLFQDLLKQYGFCDVKVNGQMDDPTKEALALIATQANANLSRKIPANPTGLTSKNITDIFGSDEIGNYILGWASKKQSGCRSQGIS